MPCSAYHEPRLAALYDALNTGREDWDFYLALAGPGPLRVLDVGCGTGGLATAFAARGHHATGADPAPAMLEIARRRGGGERVAWEQADAAGLALCTRFDLAVMTGHAFQTLLEDADIAAALANVHRHLAPGGRLAFETRNPLAREWQSWVAEDVDRVAVDGVGTVLVCYQTTEACDERVTYETRFSFPGEDTVVATDTLRFASRETLARLLAEAGFGEVAWHGDWNGAPLADSSPEIIVVAERGPATAPGGSGAPRGPQP